MALALTAPPVHALTYGPATHYPVVYQPNSVAVGDFNKDGNPDLAVANETVPGAVSVLLGDGTGAFSGPTNYTVENDAFWVAVGDFNEDTNPDLAVASVRGAEGVTILLGNGDGTFATGSHVATGETYSLAVGDFNGDHHLDIVGSEHGDFTPGINYAAGHGDGTFSAPVHYNGGTQYVAAGDVNGDGNLDIVDSGPYTNVWLGDGTGNFGPPINTVSGASGPPVLGDLNKDGKLDVAVTDGDQHLYVLLGDGTGSFTVTTGFQVPGLHTFLTIADFNQDGKPDVGVLDSYFTTVGVSFGNGTGALTAPTTWPTHDPPVGTSFGMAVADFNHDGKLDFAASGRDGARDVSILLNRTGIFYPRPKGATPMVVSLVPDFVQCTSPNNTHGAPLAYGSCSAPIESSLLTVGTPDANGAAANSVASVRFDVKASPADVAIKTSITDVRCVNAGTTTCGATNQNAGPDYIGEVQLAPTRRITDRLNYVGGVDPDQGTTQDAPFAITVPCVSTSDKKIGSTCASITTANAVLPGSVQAGARAVWQLDKLQVFDGGADGDADTPGDNTLYMDQGVFVP